MSRPSAEQLRQCAAHLEKRRRLEDQIAEVEQRIHVLESSYFEETGPFNLARGWDGFKRAPLTIKKTEGTTRLADRVLSLSSLTSPCGEAPWPRELNVFSPEYRRALSVAAPVSSQGGGASAGGGTGTGARKVKKPQAAQSHKKKAPAGGAAVPHSAAKKRPLTERSGEASPARPQRDYLTSYAASAAAAAGFVISAEPGSLGIGGAPRMVPGQTMVQTEFGLVPCVPLPQGVKISHKKGMGKYATMARLAAEAAARAALEGGGAAGADAAVGACAGAGSGADAGAGAGAGIAAGAAAAGAAPAAGPSAEPFVGV